MDAKLEEFLEKQIAEMKVWYRGGRLTLRKNRKKLAENIAELKEIVAGLEDDDEDKAEGEYAIERLKQLLKANEPKQDYPRCPKCGTLLEVMASSFYPIARCPKGCGTFIPSFEALMHESTRMMRK